MTGLWKSWMQAWCGAIVLLGVMFLAAAAPGADAAARLFYDLVYWPLDGRSVFSDDTRFTCAILGAVLIGWALTIFTLIDAADAAAPQLAARIWRGMTGAMLTWYVVDSAASIASGVPVNAISNTIFLATYLAPVLASGVLRTVAGAKLSP